jgi:solute:Na+ symporter, SSS family
MNYFTIGDWLVIVFYLAGIIALGVWFGKDQKNTRDYFLGSRNIPWWGVGLSIVATETSALTFIGIPALAFGSDLTFIQIVIGYVIARVILAIVMVPHYFKGEIYSPYQLIANAFGTSARRTAGLFFLIAATLAAGVRVYVTCIPIQLMFGFADSQIIFAILLFVGLSLIYTYVGGVKAVIWTEAAQFFLFMGGGLFVLFYIPTLLDGGMAGAMKAAAEEGKLHWLNHQFAWGELRKLLGSPYNIWMGVLGGTVFVMSTHGADQLIVQRVLTCKSVAEGRKSLILSAVIILPLFLIFLLTGAMLWVYYQQNPVMPIPLPELRPGVTKNDYIFPIFIITQVPTILKGFLIVAILSAAMSSVAAALSALSSVSTMDFIKGFARKQRSEAFYLQLSRLSTVFWALILILVAFLTQHVRSVLEAAFTLHGLTSGAMLGGLVMALWWKRGRGLPLIVGMFVSLLVMVAIYLSTRYGDQVAITAIAPIAGWLFETKIAWPWYTLIGSSVTIGVAALTRALLPAREHGEGADRI